MNNKNIISCYLPVLNNYNQILIDKLFTEEEKAKSNYFSQKDNFHFNFFEYISINYIPFSSINDLKGKEFYSINSNAFGIIESYEVINDEHIIKINYKNSLLFLEKEIVFEINQGIINENSNLFILKKYSIKPISFYYKKFELNNLNRNKILGNFKYVSIENQSKYNRKDILIIENNKKTNKNSFYFFQKS